MAVSSLFMFFSKMHFCYQKGLVGLVVELLGSSFFVCKCKHVFEALAKCFILYMGKAAYFFFLPT